MHRHFFYACYDNMRTKAKGDQKMKKKIKTQRRIGLVILIACALLVQVSKKLGVQDMTGILFIALFFGCPLIVTNEPIIK